MRHSYRSLTDFHVLDGTLPVVIKGSGSLSKEINNNFGFEGRREFTRITLKINGTRNWYILAHLFLLAPNRLSEELRKKTIEKK